MFEFYLNSTRVIADISGSVAAFARFTLHLVYAISGQFSKVRAFVFIDGLDEVTHMFEGVEDINEAVHRVNTEADVVWVDGHSDSESSSDPGSTSAAEPLLAQLEETSTDLLLASSF